MARNDGLGTLAFAALAGECRRYYRRTVVLGLVVLMLLVALWRCHA